MIYRPSNWYWIVDGDEAQVYASARGTYVSVVDETFVSWIAAGCQPTPIDSHESLVGVLRAANVAPYHLVPKRLIVDRLYAAEKLDAARAALDSADLYLRERWNTREMIFADDPSARDLLLAIGADPEAILAPAG